MAQSETNWDKLLKIKTSGRDDSKADTYHYPYEPTPYLVLERLATSGYIGKRNVLVDYGCGKGRVDFFLSYETKCQTIGVEYDERMYDKAIENSKTAVSAGRTHFIMKDATQYEVPVDVDCFYFFNPFSVEILKSVIARVIESYYEAPREMYLFFYFPSDEYIAYLMSVDELSFEDEIDCSDLFSENHERERIVVFHID